EDSSLRVCKVEKRKCHDADSQAVPAIRFVEDEQIRLRFYNVLDLRNIVGLWDRLYPTRRVLFLLVTYKFEHHIEVNVGRGLVINTPLHIPPRRLFATDCAVDTLWKSAEIFRVVDVNAFFRRKSGGKDVVVFLNCMMYTPIARQIRP